MNNWKNYTGSILLAGLLLQGCSDTPTEDSPEVTNYKTVEATNSQKLASASAAVAKANSSTPSSARSSANVAASSSASIQEKLSLKFRGNDFKAYIAQISLENGINETEARDKLAEAVMTFTDETVQTAGSLSLSPSRSSVFDKIKSGLVDILDSSLGDKITGAAFDVVLNSEGVTVFMLDLARGSQTITDVMINALDENWDLTRKMCPMLQENAEFGEKFVALADERPNLGEFFFEKIDATMYGCLTDAMILSSIEEMETEKGLVGYDQSVEHSTTGYMGVLLEKYATKYFIEPGTGAVTYKDASTDQFAKLLFTTGDVVTVDGNVTTGHGDAVELVNEQFFYAMFRTPTSTDSFVAAMGQLPDADVTMFMDEIFLGKQNTVAFGEQEDQLQGYFNIISVAGGMYEGIETYGFSKYTDAFIGFAGLIPTDRYFAYGSQFMSAGYFWAEQSGVDIWATVTDGAKDLYAQYTTPAVDAATPSSARSAGLGTISSDWISDTLDIVVSAWDGMKIDLWPEDSFLTYYNGEALKAYNTVVGSPDSNMTTVLESGETVKGFHGLIQLAIREDMVNNSEMTMTEAETAFALPAFSDITWDFVYNSASTGVVSYWDNTVNAKWLANLSDTEFVQYFYPEADNAYIPNWLMAIDWLKAPETVGESNYETIDFDFDAGYMDIYVVSTKANLIEEFNLAQAAEPVKTITMEAVTMDSDSIIAVDAGGTTLDGLYVYKIRVVSPEDTAAALAYLASLTDSALNLVGIDTDNAAQAADATASNNG